MTKAEIKKMSWREVADLWLEVARKATKRGPMWNYGRACFDYAATENAIKDNANIHGCVFCTKMGKISLHFTKLCKKCPVAPLCAVHDKITTCSGANDKDNPFYRGLIGVARIYFDHKFGKSRKREKKNA